MSVNFTEESYELAIIELFVNGLKYNYLNGYELERNPLEFLLLDVVQESLCKINKKLPKIAIEEAISKIKLIRSNDLLLNNEKFMDYLQNGVEISFIENGKRKNEIVKLIDYSDIDNNHFLVINQFSIKENNITKRPDVVVFLNGFPVVDMELKSCSREETDSSEAYRQITNRIHDIPSFYTYNCFNVISDMTYSKIGTISSDEDRYMEWKSVSGNYEESKYSNFKTLFEGVFEKNRFIELIKNFHLYSKQDGHIFKIISAYHQYFAVKKAVNATLKAIETDGKAGVIWHTQGSGKSYSMVFYSKLLDDLSDKPTIVVLTDRNDLDGQLFETFSKCKDFLRQTPVQASSRQNLSELLKDRICGGIIFTTMQKFEESEEILSDRRNIVLIADEAHRSQYGLDEKVDIKTGQIKQGYARLVRNSLPNATFIGFTGTPIDNTDRSTQEVFGNYIDIYDITQAVLDNATKPIFYENRVVKISLDEKVLEQIDKEYEVMNETAEDYHIERSKKQFAKLEELLSKEKTIETLCADILNHYKDNRSYLLTGKAMIVAYSRPIAIKIWNTIINEDSSMKGKIKVVMTSDNNDPVEWKKVDGVSDNKKDLEKEFKDDSSDLKIVIVVDMWLTGFDLPSLATMYVFKPMQDHNLMQAIARVNRVFKDKEGGLIVDYIGIANSLKSAMKRYTIRDQKNYGDQDISIKALPIFQEKLSICRDFMHGFDYSKFIKGTNLERAELIVGGINHIVCDEEDKKKYIKEALALHQAGTLCMSLLDYNTRLEASFFEAVRVAITRISQQNKLSLKDINERISNLLQHSIKDSEIINIFNESKVEFSIFDEKYLASLDKMKEKNLAVELLSKLLNDEIKAYMRTNLVQSELFSEKMKRIMNAYNNSQLTNVEVLDELIKMAGEMKKFEEETSNLGLSKEEKAFYDALLKPQAIKDYYKEKNEALINIVKELTEMLNKNKTIDWQKRENARAEMRSLVKRLLKKYDYPPKDREQALESIMAQCENWVDNN